MTNSFAQLVFYAWPLVVLLLFARLPRPEALAWTVIGSYLVLPNATGFDLPLLPTVNKNSLPVLAALLAIALGLRPDRGRHQAKTAVPGTGPARVGSAILVWGLLALLFTVPVITVLTNAEPFIAGPLIIQGLRAYDILSMINGTLFSTLPFLLAMFVFRSAQSHTALVKVLALAALIYSIPVLWEIRMSPQLQRQIYGFFPHQFLQHMRGGGFRPLVFLSHGLWLAVFMAMGTLAAAGYWRDQRVSGAAHSRRWLWAALWLFGVLGLSNSLGAFALTLLLVPLVLLVNARGQLLIASGLAATLLIYPMLRGADVIPTSRFVELARTIDPARAQSLQYRIDNEDILLEKAQQKPLAGWGTWGRNRVYDNEGRDISTTDGMWVLTIGSFGWVGYIGTFGLFCLPIMLLAFRRRKTSAATAALAVVMTCNLVDMILNATMTPLTWLIGGALAGHLIWGRAGNETPAPETAAAPDRPGPARGTSQGDAPRLTRFPISPGRRTESVRPPLQRAEARAARPATSPRKGSAGRPVSKS